MKPGKVRRFTWIQIVLHWGQAGLYLALMVTGGMLLIGRLLDAELARPEVLSVIHRGVGVALILFLAQILLTSLLTGNFVHFRRDLAEWLWIRPRDWLWLLLAPIHALWPRIKLPPAGRYNAGQKLHGAFVFLAVTLFIVTGLCMMFVPGALAAWAVHAILFLAAVCFLLLHLFLSLINPATRMALGGMFTGHVAQNYAEGHHPLWVGGDESTHHGPLISRKALLLTCLTIVLAIASLVLCFGPGRFARQVGRWMQRSALDALEPGELSAAHAAVRDCTACHRWTGAPQSSACLSCHPDIAASRAFRQGYHGKLSGDCRACHAEHGGAARSGDIRPLDAAAFNHQQTRFALRGKHQQLECAKCHTKPGGHSAAPRQRYTGLEFATCSACHDNPHGLARARPDGADDERIALEQEGGAITSAPAADSRFADCTVCHSEQGWRRPALTFDHARDSAFHLDGRHAAVRCTECHSPAVRSAGPGGARAVVTTRPDLHAIRPIPALTRHVPASVPLFALTGIGRSCADCHADPHRPTFGGDCGRCHVEAGWTGHYVRFNHNRDAKYVLGDAHEQARCEQCHRPPTARAGAVLAEAQFVGTSTACGSCHEDPHKGTLAKTCSPCHTERGWTGRELRFDHNHQSNFVLTDRHADLPCENCHVPPPPAGKLGQARFAGLGVACTTCHKDPHGGKLSADCSRCHSPRGWKGRDLLFEHNRDSSFKIDANHSVVACDACHGQPAAADHRYRGVAKTCQGCHVRQADALVGKVAGVSAPADPHAGRVDCQKCHPAEVRPLPPGPGRYANEASICRGCHGSRYSEVYSQWTRSLGERQLRAEALLAEARRRQSPRVERLAANIAQAKSVGMHNPQLAAKLWDDILQSESAGATATSQPGIRP